MSDGKHLVFLRPWGSFSRCYHVKETGAASPFYEATPAGFWQNRLDVFQMEPSARRKIFTIQRHSLCSSTHDVISSEADVLGTVTRESVLGHEWVIEDARTGVFGNVCPTVGSMNNLFCAEYEVKAVERVLCTLILKQSLWSRCQADLYYSSDNAGSVDEAMLLAASLVIMDQRGSGGAAGGSG